MSGMSYLSIFSYLRWNVRGNCGDDPDGMVREAGAGNFICTANGGWLKRVNERRSRYNVRLRILSEWHFCHGDVSRSSLLDFIAYPKFLAHPRARDAPWDALRQQARLYPIYCEHDTYNVISLSNVVHIWRV